MTDMLFHSPRVSSANANADSDEQAQGDRRCITVIREESEGGKADSGECDSFVLDESSQTLTAFSLHLFHFRLAEAAVAVQLHHSLTHLTSRVTPHERRRGARYASKTDFHTSRRILCSVWRSVPCALIAGQPARAILLMWYASAAAAGISTFCLTGGWQ